jgi:hypothetical protein
MSGRVVTEAAFGAHRPQPRLQPLGEISRRPNLGDIPNDEECAADQCVMVRTPFALQQMTLHPHQVDAWQQIVDKGDVFLVEFATIHQRQLPSAQAEGSGALSCHAVPRGERPCRGDARGAGAAKLGSGRQRETAGPLRRTRGFCYAAAGGEALMLPFLTPVPAR